MMNTELMSSMVNKNDILVNDFLPLTEDQREKLLLVISQWAKHIKNETHKHPTFVDIKYSGLLRRLLDGKPAYKHPVPRNNMQPWYEVMTGEPQPCNSPNIMMIADAPNGKQAQVMLGQYHILDDSGEGYRLQWPDTPYEFSVSKDADGKWWITRTDQEE